MSALIESEKLDDPEFKWVRKRNVGGKNRDVQFYDSFTYDGVDYALYDCVYMYKQGAPAPYIGKLVKMWETALGIKKIKVQWFFRPSEISYYLKDAEVLENELFFASGDGIGLANLNPVEAIAGKCNVVCTSTDSRNPQPSVEELEMADYVFYRVFDVKSCTMSDQMDDKVGGLEVNFVFNRREGVRILDGPKLDSSEKYERNVVPCKETLKIAGNISPQQLNNRKLDKNGNRALEEEDTNMTQEPVKLGSLLGKHSSSVDVVSSRNREITGTTLEVESTMGAKNFESTINEKKDKSKDMKAPVNQVQVETGVKQARKSCDLDGAPSKRAKFDGSVSLDSNGVQGLSVPRYDTAQQLPGVTTSNAKLKPGLVKDFVGCKKDVKLTENSSPLDEKLSKTRFSSSKDVSGSGHEEDAVGVQKIVKSNEDLNALQGKLSKTKSFSSTAKEKSESVHRKDSFVAERDKKLGDNLSFRGENPSATNLVSRDHDETKTPSPTNATPKAPKLVPNKELDRSEQVAKPVQSLSTSMKRPLEIGTEGSKEKSNLGHKSHENKEKKLASNLCPNKDGGYLKKAKLDNSIKRSEEYNNIKKFKEKSNVVETKSSPKIAAFGDNKVISRLGEGASKEYHNENEQNHVDGAKKSPNFLTSHDNKTKSRLGERPSKEYHNEKDGKRFNDKLPNSVTTKSKDDGKVGGKIIEVTRRPLEKATWIKLSWEQQMKTAHDQGRLVLLLNLDPEYTSGEVEDIIWHTFRESCTARMVPHTAISNPYSGQAFVVLKTKDAANKVVQKLGDGCLMLPNQRPLVACHGVLPEFFGMKTPFVGHLVLDRSRRQIQRDMKEAVSTSHYSQHNTIEFEMAMDWCMLQSKSDKWWEKLYEVQHEELKRLTENL